MTPESSDVVSRQYEALRSGRGVVLLDDWSRVAVTGADRQSFLHNFSTNDVKRLSPDERCEAFFTSAKGKVVGHGLISCRENELVVIAVPGQAPPLIEHLDRYIIREDVQLRDTTREFVQLLIAGDQTLCNESLRSVLDEWNTSVYCSGWFRIGDRFATLVETSKSNLQLVSAALESAGFVSCSHTAFETFRIECGLPLFGVDFDDRNLPQEVGRNAEAISFTKGCYLGQETVARIDALGHVNQQLAGVRFSGKSVPEGGVELLGAGINAGRVTSASFSPQLQSPLALAMLRREFAAVGKPLESSLGPCDVIRLPV